jgi:hypothetical protein
VTSGILDDPVRPGVHNKKGTISFDTGMPGAKNGRASRLFINTKDNAGRDVTGAGRGLDKLGYRPIGSVVKGMEVRAERRPPLLHTHSLILALKCCSSRSWSSCTCTSTRTSTW